MPLPVSGNTGCDILTIGQYLPHRTPCQSGPRVSREEFKEYEDFAYTQGFAAVLASPRPQFLSGKVGVSDGNGPENSSPESQTPRKQ